MSTPTSTPAPEQLQRVVGLPGAILLGLGSILGTGVFVSIGIGAQIAQGWVLLAIALASLVAMCNGLSSAQLAANHPVSGGTYEYGYRYLTPLLGFLAGWMFLCAKSASAATAALGAAGYFLTALGSSSQLNRVLLAVLIVMVFTLLVLSGLKRSNFANLMIVGLTIVSLLVFVVGGVQYMLSGHGPYGSAQAQVQGGGYGNWTESPPFPWAQLFEATALMFVAYTGYGRVATLGEEIQNPRRNIPIAVILTLVVSLVMYVLVAASGLLAVGGDEFGAISRQGSAAPLEVIARRFSLPGASWILTIGAITAMLGVLLNLIIGLSRVALAMGRRRDFPEVFSRLYFEGTMPLPAVLLVSGIILALAFIGNVKTTWSFSAFTVLIYYALTNLAALRISNEDRLYPRWISWLGLFGCLGLAFWVEMRIWLIGLSLIAVGALWHWLARSLQKAE